MCRPLKRAVTAVKPARFTRVSVARAAPSTAAERCGRSLAATASSSFSSSSFSSSSKCTSFQGRRRSVAAFASADDVSGIPDRNLRKDLSAAEYAELKSWLLRTTGLYGLGLTAYSTLGYGLANGLSAALGTAGSLVYLVMLGQYVDELKGSELDEEAYTRNLVYEPVTDVFSMLGGAFGKVGQVYSQALLQKRLLVPVVIAASSSAFNALDAPFDFNYGPMLLGFLTYKAAVLTKLYEDLKPDIIKAIAGGGDGDGE